MHFRGGRGAAFLEAFAAQWVLREDVVAQVSPGRQAVQTMVVLLFGLAGGVVGTATVGACGRRGSGHAVM